jgi:hypothetical protein
MSVKDSMTSKNFLELRGPPLCRQNNFYILRFFFAMDQIFAARLNESFKAMAARRDDDAALAERYAKMLARSGPNAETTTVDDAALAERYAKMQARYAELPTGPVIFELSIPPAFWRLFPAAWFEHERGNHGAWLPAYEAWIRGGFGDTSDV